MQGLRGLSPAFTQRCDSLCRNHFLNQPDYPAHFIFENFDMPNLRHTGEQNLQTKPTHGAHSGSWLRAFLGRRHPWDKEESVLAGCQLSPQGRGASPRLQCARCTEPRDISSLRGRTKQTPQCTNPPREPRAGTSHRGLQARSSHAAPQRPELPEAGAPRSKF